ncbi:MAG: ClpXP protease specificity-enhancing factor [Burkholderiales bacterium]|nr:ClpXP protease specificity-enhancing factor [Burkholderiales bacterium]
MKKDLSTKPYLIRAIYDWCADSDLTPYLAVQVDESTKVPVEYVKNGEIVLNISQDSTRNLTLGNDLIQFSARFSGVSREVSIPVHAVSGIFAKESGVGLFFEAMEGEPAGKARSQRERTSETPKDPPPSGGRPRLQVIK